MDEQEIIAKYPALFRRPDFELECGPGWYPIVEAVCETLMTTPEPQELVQVKQKFGELTIYAADPDPFTYGVVGTAALVSQQTCEVCGEPGDLLNDAGFVFTRCVDHAQPSSPTQPNAFTRQDVRVAASMSEEFASTFFEVYEDLEQGPYRATLGGLSIETTFHNNRRGGQSERVEILGFDDAAQPLFRFKFPRETLPPQIAGADALAKRYVELTKNE